MKKLLNVLLICISPLLSKAAIIYTAVNPAQSFQLTGNFGSNLIPIDFNGDAVNEITFRYDVFGPEWFSHTFEVGASDVARTGTTNPYGAAYAMKFNSGSLINASSFTATNGFDPLLADNADSSFVNQGYKFIGVRFVVGSNTYYGWVSVQMTSVNGLRIVYVNGYAYENTPSTGITAGNTGSSVNQPTATTNAATAISTSGATLNGTVNANNAATTVTFEYGTTTAYGSSVSATPGTVTGSTATAVLATLSSLVPNTTYHFRTKAVNAGGTAYGNDMTFITAQQQAPTVSAASASGITSSGASLSGNVNANGAAATISFEYGLTTAYGSTVNAVPATVTGTSTTPVTASLSGLQAGKVYHFRLKAVNSGGTTYSSDATFSTTTTGIAQVGQVSSIFLFPNPASATVQINNPERLTAKVVVADALGHLVWQGELATDKDALSIDTTPWAPGNYMVILQTPDRRNTVLQLAVRH